MTFDTYQKTPKNQVAFNKALAFAEYIHGTKSFYLYGSPGNGKTHLLVAAMQKAAESIHSYEYEFFNMARLLKIERQDYETKEEAEDRLLTKLSKRRYVFLDDFSAENVSGRTAEFVYLLLDDAISSGKTRFFITGNKSIKHISDNVSARIASRIVGLCGKENIVKIEAEDWRLK